MDDLLHTLESEGSGVSIQGLYAGGAIHADDIRTLSSSKYDVTSQAQIVSQFASDKGLKVNPTKSEVVAFSNNNSKPADDQVDICGKSVSLSSSGCCLGYHWSRDLLPTQSVAHNIIKARNAFFCGRQYWCMLNPLSSRSVYVTCVLPIL